MKVAKFCGSLVFLAVSSIFTSPSHAGSQNSHPINGQNEAFFNQLGYTPHETKRVTIVGDESSTNCEVLNSVGQVVLRVNLRELSPHPDYPVRLRQCDVSALREVGDYRVQTQQFASSLPLHVRQDPINELFFASIRAFYFQRASLTLTPETAGPWSRPAGHPDRNLRTRVDGEAEQRIDAPGGWYDAGDYGKYVVNAGISVGTLLLLAEHYPDAIGDRLNIPESGNRISDLLDEVRYELEWLLSMQDKDGGVFFKVGSSAWAGFVMPHLDQQERLIIGKSTGSTLNLAAVAAHASRVFLKIDRHFSHQLLKAAEAAWRWARQNPNIDAPTYEGGGTGAYPDGVFQDEFLWAASHLARATKSIEYRQFLHRAIESSTLKDESAEALWWRKTTTIAYLGLSRLSDTDILSRDLQTKVRQEIVSYARRVASTARHEPFHIPYRGDDFIWGSNGGLANLGMVLAEAYTIDKDPAFLETMRATAHYLLGHNIHGITFVTGFGYRSVRAPHHRIIGSDTVHEAIPGFIVGGPNIEKPDAIFGIPYGPVQTGPFLYVDNQHSFGSNEVAINWSAAFSYLLAAIQHDSKTVIPRS